MPSTKSRRTPQQQLALEKKLGTTLLACLFGIFLFVLSAKIGGLGWSNEQVEVNIGGTAANTDGGPTNSSYTSTEHGTTADSAEPYSPPKVFLPPAPPPMVATYPLPAKPAAAPATQPPTAVAMSTMPTPVPASNGNRYANVTVAAPAAPPATTPPPTHPPAAVIPAAPTVREPGVASIGLVAGTSPVAPANAPRPATAAQPIPSAPPLTTPPQVSAMQANVPAIAAIPPAATRTAAPPAASFASSSVYVFAEGDNYWTIAKKAYGDGAFYRALYAFNADRYPHPEDLRPGDKIDVPSLAELRSRFPQLCPTSDAVGNR